MTPLGFWMLIFGVSVVYNAVKYLVTGSFDFDGFFGAVWWVGYAMIALHYGWVTK